MEVNLPCETYSRLANIVQIAEDKFKTLRIERKNGLTVAIATNRRIAAIEQLPDATADGAFNLVFDHGLLAQCEQEKAFNGNINIVLNSMLQFATAKTTFGYIVQGNAAVYNNVAEWDHWRTWLPDKLITKAVGGMYWDGMIISALANSSPSGMMVFPQLVDCNKPVLLRDYVDPKWIGLFMPNVRKEDGSTRPCEPATAPEWLK